MCRLRLSRIDLISEDRRILYWVVDLVEGSVDYIKWNSLMKEF